MKLKITLLFAVLMMAMPEAFAGFPVTRTVNATVETTTIDEATADVALTSPAATQADRQTIAILLWLFLGAFAAHRWYLGSPLLWNVIFILTAGFFVVGWIIDGIDILTGSYPGL